MALVINNLPKCMFYRDIKNLIRDRCGVNDVSLENLKESTNGRQVTVQVKENGDAAILMRTFNGMYLMGNQLFVELKPAQQIIVSAPNVPAQNACNWGNQAQMQQPAFNERNIYNASVTDHHNRNKNRKRTNIEVISSRNDGRTNCSQYEFGEPPKSRIKREETPDFSYNNYSDSLGAVSKKECNFTKPFDHVTPVNQTIGLSNNVVEPQRQYSFDGINSQLMNYMNTVNNLIQSFSPNVDPIRRQPVQNFPQQCGVNPLTGDILLCNNVTQQSYINTTGQSMNNMTFPSLDLSSQSINFAVAHMQQGFTNSGGPNNDNGFGNASGPSNVSGYVNASGFGNPSGPGNVSGYVNASGFGNPSGPGNVSGYVKTSGFGNASGPGNVSGYVKASGFGNPSGPGNASRFGFPSGPGNVSGFGKPSGPGNASRFGNPSGPGNTSGIGYPSGPGNVSGYVKASGPGNASEPNKCSKGGKGNKSKFSENKLLEKQPPQNFIKNIEMISNTRKSMKKILNRDFHFKHAATNNIVLSMSSSDVRIRNLLERTNVKTQIKKIIFSNIENLFTGRYDLTVEAIQKQYRQIYLPKDDFQFVFEVSNEVAEASAKDEFIAGQNKVVARQNAAEIQKKIKKPYMEDMIKTVKKKKEIKKQVSGINRYGLNEEEEAALDAEMKKIHICVREAYNQVKLEIPKKKTVLPKVDNILKHTLALIRDSIKKRFLNKSENLLLRVSCDCNPPPETFQKLFQKYNVKCKKTPHAVGSTIKCRDFYKYDMLIALKEVVVDGYNFKITPIRVYNMSLYKHIEEADSKKSNNDESDDSSDEEPYEDTSTMPELTSNRQMTDEELDKLILDIDGFDNSFIEHIIKESKAAIQIEDEETATTSGGIKNNEEQNDEKVLKLEDSSVSTGTMDKIQQSGPGETNASDCKVEDNQQDASSSNMEQKNNVEKSEDTKQMQLSDVVETNASDFKSKEDNSVNNGNKEEMQQSSSEEANANDSEVVKKHEETSVSNTVEKDQIESKDEEQMKEVVPQDEIETQSDPAKNVEANAEVLKEDITKGDNVSVNEKLDDTTILETNEPVSKSDGVDISNPPVVVDLDRSIQIIEDRVIIEID